MVLQGALGLPNTIQLAQERNPSSRGTSLLPGRALLPAGASWVIFSLISIYKCSQDLFFFSSVMPVPSFPHADIHSLLPPSSLFFFFSKRNVSTFAKTEPLFLHFSNANVSLWQLSLKLNKTGLTLLSLIGTSSPLSTSLFINDSLQGTLSPVSLSQRCLPAAGCSGGARRADLSQGAAWSCMQPGPSCCLSSPRNHHLQKALCLF